jgi:hypothetical protein
MNAEFSLSENSKWQILSEYQSVDTHYMPVVNSVLIFQHQSNFPVIVAILSEATFDC